jgi:hypothetical protein
MARSGTARTLKIHPGRREKIYSLANIAMGGDRWARAAWQRLGRDRSKNRTFSRTERRFGGGIAGSVCYVLM